METPDCQKHCRSKAVMPVEEVGEIGRRNAKSPSVLVETHVLALLVFAQGVTDGGECRAILPVGGVRYCLHTYSVRNTERLVNMQTDLSTSCQSRKVCRTRSGTLSLFICGGGAL